MMPEGGICVKSSFPSPIIPFATAISTQETPTIMPKSSLPFSTPNRNISGRLSAISKSPPTPEQANITIELIFKGSLEGKKLYTNAKPVHKTAADKMEIYPIMYLLKTKSNLE